MLYFLYWWDVLQYGRYWSWTFPNTSHWRGSSSEELPNFFAPDVHCMLLFTSPFDCVSGVSYLQYFLKPGVGWGIPGANHLVVRALRNIWCYSTVQCIQNPYLEPCTRPLYILYIRFCTKDTVASLWVGARKKFINNKQVHPRHPEHRAYC